MASFNFPTDVYPTSSSQSTSYGGLPGQYGEDVLASVIPMLRQQVGNMPGNIDEYVRQAQLGYTGGVNEGLKTTLPSVLNNLASRNMLNSSVASDAISKTARGVQNQFAPALYGATMQGAGMKANMPSVLGNLAGLGQVSQGGTTSQSQDPSTMYRAYMNFLSSI